MTEPFSGSELRLYPLTGPTVGGSSAAISKQASRSSDGEYAVMEVVHATGDLSGSITSLLVILVIGRDSTI